MNTKTSSENGFLILRTVSTLTLFLVATLLACLAFVAPKLPASAWRAKVDPEVLTAAESGETEFIIYLSPTADLSGAKSLRTKAEKGKYVFEKLKNTAEATQPAVRQTLSSRGAEYRSFWISNVIWAKGNLGALEAVAPLPQVFQITRTPKGGLKLPSQQPASTSKNPASRDSVDAIEPSLISVHANDVWAMGYMGQGAVVAGCDSGVRWTHSGLKNRYRGWNGTSADHDYNWKDGIHNVNPGCPGDSPEPCDDDIFLGGGHGSHTMGTMVGDDGGNNRTGMAPQAKWMACRNMNQGVGAPITGYLECMQFMLAPTRVNGADPDPSKAPDVINNSWGCVEPGCLLEPNPPVPGFLRATLQASRAAGIVYVVSAGNDGQGGTGDCSTLQFPLARYPESFSVGATNHVTDQIADFSSRGPVLGDPDFPTGLPKPNISAPGVNIRSSLRGSDTEYGSLSGTSMSGPHVAGLVALMISANPHLAGNVQHIEELIQQTAVPRTTSQACGSDTATSVPNNVYGWGRIDALAAVTAAAAEATPVSLISIASRKIHNGAGTFDVILPVADPVGVECRVGQPADGQHTIVFTFAQPLSSVTNAAIDSGTGFISSKGIGTDPHEYIVNVGGVPNAERLRVTLTAVTDTAGNTTPTLSVAAGFLLGDTTANGAVNASDISQTKAQTGQAATGSNFRNDVNLSGVINSTDIALTKANSGTTLP